MNSPGLEIVVIGAGMVGACAALALAKKGFRVTIVESNSVTASDVKPGTDYDLRVSAISPGSRSILERLGVWQRLDQARVCNYEQMHIWHQHGSASVAFDAVDLARDNLGSIVENREIQQAIYGACEEHATIEWFMPDSIEALLDNHAGGVELRLASGRCLEAGLLIAADGRNSPTRNLAGFEVQHGQYRQTAIVANVDTELAHQHTAWQRFLSTGPLAFLPLSNGQCSIVWSCDDEFAASLVDAGDEEFCTALGEAFEFRLGAIKACGARLKFPLGWHQCERWLMGRILLIGDAAHSVHPLAGQGVNLGFSDVELLAALLDTRAETFSPRQLRRYERQRKSETWVASQSFSALKWVYGSDQKCVNRLRDLGMRVVEQTPWFKRSLMEKAIQNLT